MNRKELIKELQRRTHLDPTIVQLFLTTQLDIITETLQNNEKISIYGFGTLYPKTVRVNQNFQTNGNTTVSSVHFKPGQRLKNRLNERKNS